MKHLSPESIGFLRNIKNKSIAQDNSESWGNLYTRLFCDLFNIVRSANEELNDFAIGKWFITYENTDDQSELSFRFALSLSNEKKAPEIQITIQPFGESSIEVLPVDNRKMDFNLTGFYNSGAYKRYFQDYKDESLGLKTVISSKQITSRHFGDYIVHLLTMMKPYIESPSPKDSAELIAA